MFTALIDACVLWPNMRRNFLLALAVEGSYRPVWSDVLLEEVEAQEFNRLIGKGVLLDDANQRSTRLVSEMRAEFPDALATGWEPLEGSFGLPDADDEHVLAAALIGGAGALVTENLKHFPRALVPVSIDLVNAAQFAFDCVSANPFHGLAAARSIVEHSGQGGLPKRTLEQVYAQLEVVYGMGDTVQILRDLGVPAEEGPEAD